MSDELMQLWQHGASSDPDPEAVARLAAKATMRRFDRAIFWRNFREYAAGLVVMVVFGWEAFVGEDPARNTIGFTCVAFVMGYLWWQHRDLPTLDPAANARVYQAAMLERVDRQIRLLKTVRYWYVVPLYIPPILQAVGVWERRGWVPAATNIVIVTVVYWLVLRLNERWGVAKLREERARIEALYQG